MNEILVTIGKFLVPVVGSGLIFTIIKKLIPNDRIKSKGVALGIWISGLGRMRFGLKKWESMERFIIEDALLPFVQGLSEGLNQDDKVQ